MPKQPKVAIVADWLINKGGAERVVLAMRELFPNAPIYTSIYNPEKTPGFEDAIIKTSFIQKLPYAKTKHSFYFPLMPYAFEQFDFGEYDIVLSSCHSAAKGIITKPRTMHISYCHSPMRYCWDESHQYIEQYGLNPLLKTSAKKILTRMRVWDRAAADRVDFFVANSHYINKRIKKYYRRDSEVIHPPVDYDFFSTKSQRGEYFLAVGRLTPYKRFDLIIDVFNELKWPLVIVGSGKEEKKLKGMAGPTVEFLGDIPDDTLKTIYSKAIALIFPQVEDFGITPLEAMSTGKPVIAYAKGGALETVNPGVTGLFFEEQSNHALKKTLLEFEALKWNSTDIKKHAKSFDKKVFKDKLSEFIDRKWDLWSREMV